MEVIIGILALLLGSLILIIILYAVGIPTMMFMESTTKIDYKDYEGIIIHGALASCVIGLAVIIIIALPYLGADIIKLFN